MTLEENTLKKIKTLAYQNDFNDKETTYFIELVNSGTSIDKAIDMVEERKLTKKSVKKSYKEVTSTRHKANISEYKAAKEELLTYARQGDADGQCALGYMYYTGEGVPQDYKKAMKWLRKAAEQGNGTAQGMLYKMYYTGEGVPQDYKEADKWLRKMAE